MAKLYRALVGFNYPADAQSLKKLKAARKIEDPEKQAEAMEAVEWARHEPKDKPFPAPSDEILKSWLDNDAVEEVKD